MITFDEARKIVLDSVSALEPVEAPILDALGLVAAEDVTSTEPIPPFDNSAMDGYAAHAEDTSRATEKKPVELAVLMDLPAGHYTERAVGRGEAVRIMTGAPIPPGADTVVQVELTEKLSDNRVRILKEHEKGKNIRLAGEDIAIGQSVLRAGEEIGPAKIGLLASLGRLRVKVVRRPVIAVLATGDELLDVDEPMAPGKIRSSNSYTLISQARACGAEARYLGIARDTIDDVRDRLRKGLSADMIVSSGGVSVGDYDYVKNALEELGVEFLFTKVAIRPGKPTVFGLLNRKPVFGLPGNPVSSMVIFEEFVRPALLKMIGKRRLHRPVVEAVLEEDIKKKPERMHLIRAIVRKQGSDYFATTTGPQGSGILVSMDRANGIILFPRGEKQRKKGDRVEVQLITMPEVE
ncbi:MAG: molybdopterin molybdenumtransferase MoeA [Candidatus Abyssobacteria bacterium SURF_17]|uniref:Molybdopterin molybdenumtransferase n=1 Tax=Candidatus Abyssobacteria bacterium SURF_17 TaxID=2093361 RepID=A0A419ESM3_9BACT|nr:MAG: molybdopterin molybdenumtransferase MoeA [Candidatus Abyssubacteria bacterium SURF_17]